MNVSGIDLNLLRIFDLMMQERSATRVAERVGLSQPAVSAALARLRHLTQDELFVREGARMVPTSKAEAMQEPVRAAMARIEAAFDVAFPFDPARSDRRFRLLGSDYFSTLLMPPLADAVSRTAPEVVLQMLDMPMSRLVPALSEGAVDLGLGPSAIEPPDYVGSRTLFRSYVVTVNSRRNATIRDAGVEPGARIPPGIFCSLPHAVMSMDGSMRGTVDWPLERQGLSRKVLLTLPHFYAVALAVASGRFIANLPVHYAYHVAPLLDLEVYLPPFDAPIMDVNLYWHRRHDGDSANLWLRTLIAGQFSLDDRYPPQDEALAARLAAHSGGS